MIKDAEISSCTSFSFYLPPAAQCFPALFLLYTKTSRHFPQSKCHPLPLCTPLSFLWLRSCSTCLSLGCWQRNTPWKSWQCLEGRRERECYRGCFGWASWRLRPLWRRCCSRTDRNCLGCHRWIWPPPLGEFDRSCLGRSRRLIGYIGGLWFSLFFCFDYGFIVDYYSKISLYIDCIIIYQWQKKLIIVEY